MQLVKITKVADEQLRPHVPRVASTILESLSSLENQAFNYVSLHAESMDIKQGTFLFTIKSIWKLCE